MPKLVKEVTSGQSNERSSENGSLADVSVRTWRIVLDSPSEAYDIQKEVGVYIGDPHPVNTTLPCVSIGERAEGDSRVVRIVTATYRTTVGNPDNPEGRDVKLDPPEVRPANYSITSQLMEVPVDDCLNVNGDANDPNFDQGQTLTGQNPPKNPLGDPIDGLFKSIPIIIIRIEQFVKADAAPVGQLEHVGAINADDIAFVGFPIQKHAAMLRSLDIKPHVESWRNEQPRRGFMCTYEFCVKTRPHVWNIKFPLTGFNIKNAGLNQADVDKGALTLELTDSGKIKDWPANPQLAAGLADAKVRANVLIAHHDGGASQRPSAQPVALKEDGTPLKVSKDTPPIIREIRVQPAIPFQNNFAAFGIRLT